MEMRRELRMDKYLRCESCALGGRAKTAGTIPYQAVAIKKHSLLQHRQLNIPPD
jgi:hypothetical protein